MEKFTIFGIRAILEALNSEKPIDKVWLLKGTQSKLFEQLQYKLREKNIAFSFVPVERLSRFSEKNHQGAVARIGAIKTVEMEPLIEGIMQTNKNPLFLLLDGITDVRNFGAILRSAAASGIDAVFIPSSGSAPLNGDTIKTSAGGAFKVPISKVNHLKDVLFYLKAQEVSILALTEKASQTIYQQDLKGPTALIFGSEDIGISSGVLKLADVKAKLPIENEIDSLNVSVACGIVFYEAIRQRL
ncbi:23S rRNA (guanosine(2251)-2'-O)-methyltransferase RlmB [Flavobacteriaceae bacterium]|jgi:23S rRNA (guanosine2251-2'-O)-methyltransferase|nr:23S rRNA (guanosine(2251)-2'-O)-methyltransferase RlmB [Flavobacteriaceae bacterium]